MKTRAAPGHKPATLSFLPRGAYSGSILRDAPATKAGRPMRTITTTEDLASFCEAAKAAPYVTLDT